MVDSTMNTVKLQAYSWISETMGSGDSQGRTLNKKVRPGTTLYELFTDLADTYPEFRRQIFDPAAGDLNDQVLVIVNSRLIQSKDFKETPVNDKDSITLSPVLVGG